MTTTIVETETVERDYGMRGTNMILDHPRHGRLLVCDGYGGVGSVDGGAVRWRHGAVYQLLPGDTLAGLRSATVETGSAGSMTLMDRMRHGYDDRRPILDWAGYVIERMVGGIEGVA